MPAHLASCLALAGTGAPITSRQQHDLSFSSMSIAIGAPHACALLSLLACRTLYGGICSPVMPVLTCHHLLPGCLTLTRRKALLIISTACCCSQTWLATSSPLCLRIFASLFADACSPRDCRCPRFSRLTSLHTRRPYLCQHRCFLTPPPNDLRHVSKLPIFLSLGRSSGARDLTDVAGVGHRGSRTDVRISMSMRVGVPVMT